MSHTDLAIAIVQRAAADYRAAKWRYENGTYLQKAYAAAEMEKIEGFFKSKWADVLCDGNAAYVLKRLQEEETPKKLKRKKWGVPNDKV
jgi:hypothetical protein